jgi:AcrR family transcriptional regulator
LVDYSHGIRTLFPEPAKSSPRPNAPGGGRLQRLQLCRYLGVGGISKASIHHHFPSKAELVQTVVRRYRDEAQKGLAAIQSHISDPLAQLQAYTGYWEACIRDGSSSFCICAMLAAELPAIPEQVADEVRGHFCDLAAWLASVLERAPQRESFGCALIPSRKPWP